ANSSFETPEVKDFQAHPEGAGWSFEGKAGIAHNGSGLKNPPAPGRDSDEKSPANLQVAYVQGKGGLKNRFSIPARQTSDVYGVTPKAHAGSGEERLQVFIDDEP